MRVFYGKADRSAVILGAAVIIAILSLPAASQEPARRSSSDYRFTADNRLEFPADYRESVFLSAGRGMTYGPAANPNGPPVFDNVFVNRAAHCAFLKTGRWPEQTIFVLEVRKAATEGSINSGGQFQKEVTSLEVEIKDKRFTDTQGWGFFEFDVDHQPAKRVPKGESCYTCHSAHGAVEQTFVQFYPTLIPVAAKHGTLKKKP